MPVVTMTPSIEDVCVNCWQPVSFPYSVRCVAQSRNLCPVCGVVTVALQDVFVWLCFAGSLLTSLLVLGPSEAPGWAV